MFYFLGKITQYNNDRSGVIDKKYLFPAGAAENLELRVGDRVSCKARKISDDQPVVIYKIDSVHSDTWGGDDEEDYDDTSTRDLVALRTYTKMVRGEIKLKFNGEIIVHDGASSTIRLKISEIGCTFNPMVGDQVEAEVQFGFDPKDLDKPHEMTGYYGMKPIDTTNITGKITKFRKKMQYGLVDDKFIFYMDVLQHSSNQNFLPNVNDDVFVEAISSHQTVDDQNYYHRCVSLTPVTINRNGRLARSKGIENDPNDVEDEIDDDNCGMTFTRNEELKVLLESSLSQKTIELVVINNSDSPRRINKVSFSNQILESHITCDALYGPRNIQPNGRFVYKIDVTKVRLKSSKLLLNFNIDNKYTVRRCITIDVKNVEEVTAPRVEHSKAYTHNIYDSTIKTNKIKGRAPVVAPHFIDRRLQPHTVPNTLFDNTIKATTTGELSDLYADIFCSLTPSKYAKFFHHLLWFEECYMRHEFRTYDQDRGHFTRDGEYLAYEMKRNVFECRPSIVIGDQINAQSLLLDPENKDKEYGGFIHRIDKHRLRLKFDEEFQNAYRGEDYKLIFKFSRSKFIKQHNAIERIDKRMRDSSHNFLFPTTIKLSEQLQYDVRLVNGNIELQFPKRTLPWCNPKLNEIQKKAVINVQKPKAKRYPYLIFGPPVRYFLDSIAFPTFSI